MLRHDWYICSETRRRCLGSRLVCPAARSRPGNPSARARDRLCRPPHAAHGISVRRRRTRDTSRLTRPHAAHCDFSRLARSRCHRAARASPRTSHGSLYLASRRARNPFIAPRAGQSLAPRAEQAPPFRREMYTSRSARPGHRLGELGRRKDGLTFSATCAAVPQVVGNMSASIIEFTDTPLPSSWEQS